MNDNTHRHSVVVGLFVLIGLAILVAGVLLIGNLNKTLQHRIKIVTYFDDVNGLQKGNFIWFSGVRIGTVKSLRLSTASGVEIVMDIDEKVKEYIHKDSKVKLGSDGLIGNRILIIFGGNAKTGNVEEGDTLRFERTLSTDDLVGTLQSNNENLKAITSDFKIISRKLADGEGTIGKLLNDDSFYDNLNSVALSLKASSVKAQQLMNSLADFSAGLKKHGTLAYELTSDTASFTSVRASLFRLRQIADTASVLINHLKQAESNPATPAGTLLHDQNAGTDLKETMLNLRKSTDKMNEDLEALQHTFPLKHYFRNKAKNSK